MITIPMTPEEKERFLAALKAERRKRRIEDASRLYAITMADDTVTKVHEAIVSVTGIPDEEVAQCLKDLWKRVYRYEVKVCFRNWMDEEDEEE